MAFEARYPGLCSDECGDPINIGDLIISTGHDGEWAHLGCTPRRNRPIIICVNCNLVKPCECDA